MNAFRDAIAAVVFSHVDQREVADEVLALPEMQAIHALLGRLFFLMGEMPHADTWDQETWDTLNALPTSVRHWVLT